ncbi:MULTISPECIES: hypothetical protein [Lactococcus]|uniref:hypothetical protein n=1 Tax=Lactococcus TaxID=1357 RepID=UPI00223BDAFB|nr:MULTISPECIES: hypothetical protein [Lactococcus]MCT0055578.1 hypothetical protein [Lactococcus lactis subsp. lactis]MDT2551411.1 hypothetical protein [Lactococcus petauri]MDT2561643.1 hypothetical protein [Lactococcus petauri]MDT2580836.1 hypothetical protein [Lactococcus petauri]MDT2876030.1 hypothetical protein [Lactococcus lactis]
MIIFIIVLIIIAVVFILMVMGGLESYDPKSDNKGFVSNNISDSATKDEFQENKKIEFEQKYPKIKWRVIRYATNYFDYEERDFDNEYEARDLERYLISGMRDTKDYFKPARVEVKRVQRIGNENSSYIYYK